MPTASPAKIPAPTRNADVAIATRFTLGTVLDGVEFIYDYNGADESIYLRVMQASAPGTITSRADSCIGTWLALCSVDESRLNPISPEIDFDGVEGLIGMSLAVVVPLALEAIAIFYDSDETTTLHRRALRMFYRGLAASRVDV